MLAEKCFFLSFLPFFFFFSKKKREVSGRRRRAEEPSARGPGPPGCAGREGAAGGRGPEPPRSGWGWGEFGTPVAGPRPGRRAAYWGGGVFPRPSPRAGGWGRGGPCSSARGARGACRPAPLASAGSGVPQAGRLGSAGVDAAQVGSINVFVAVEAAEWLTRDGAPARGPGSGRGPPPECVARRLPRECRGRGAVEVSRGAPRGRASALPGRPSRAWGTGWPPRGRRGSGSGRGGRGRRGRLRVLATLPE